MEGQLKHLTETEKELVMQFITHEKMADAVLKVLTDGIYQQGSSLVGVEREPNRNWAWSVLTKGDSLTDEQVGKCLRSVMEGIAFLETSFKNMRKLKPAEKVEVIKAKGR